MNEVILGIKFKRKLLKQNVKVKLKYDNKLNYTRSLKIN